MTLEEILSRNASLKKERTTLMRTIRDIDSRKVAPCFWCKHDGLFRCESCRDDFYGDFELANKTE